MHTKKDDLRVIIFSRFLNNNAKSIFCLDGAFSKCKERRQENEREAK